MDTAQGLAIYHRWGEAADGRLERFIIVLNFSGVDRYVDVPLSANGVWRELLGGEEHGVEDCYLPAQLITSNWGKIFYQKI